MTIDPRDKAMVERIAILTDFGAGLYMGQMRARLQSLAPGVPQIDLVHDLPAFRPDLAAYLLAALRRDMPSGTVYLCVVDPGVGGERDALLVRAGRDWLVGPDNGLLATVVRSARCPQVWRVGWRPDRLSASFHGRDWFAPIAARVCRGEPLLLMDAAPASIVGADWPAELEAVIYVDRYGNVITGMQAPRDEGAYVLPVGLHLLPRARTFCDLAVGEAFWYENAFGLVEIAVNQGRADVALGLSPGDSVGALTPEMV